MYAMVHNVLIYVVPFLMVLTLVITVHELGHFLVARALGIAVDRFSIGFGRAIFSWTDRWGCEWRVGWIPLGGYVRFAGDAEASSTVPDAEHLAHLKAEIRDREGAGAEQRYYHFKPVWARALVAAAGPVANFILAVVLMAGVLIAVGDLVIRPRVGAVDPGTPAARAGFMAGDLVKSLDGRRIDDFRDLKQFIILRAGEPIHFTVDRGGKDIDIVATPERRPQTDEVTGFTTRMGVLGFHMSAAREDVFVKRYGPVEALVGGVRRTKDVIETNMVYLGRLARGLESGDQIGGLLRMGAISGKVAEVGASGGANLGGKIMGGGVALLNLAAVLSVGIGFMNLMPVPVLDGGHLLFYAYEALFRRPLGARIQAAGYRVGLALLLGLMLFATWNDLQQLHVIKLLGGLFT